MVGECFDGRVADDAAAAERTDVVADCVEEVRLPKPGRGVKEQGVVGLAGQLGDGQRRGVSEPVAVADDELIEAVAGVEASGRGFVGHPGAVSRGRCVSLDCDLEVGPGHRSRTAFEDPAEPLGDPRAGRRRRGQEQHASFERRDLERGDPDLVSGLADDAAELRPNRAPQVVRLEVVRQLQATPSRERSSARFKRSEQAARRRRIYQWTTGPSGRGRRLGAMRDKNRNRPGSGNLEERREPLRILAATRAWAM